MRFIVDRRTWYRGKDAEGSRLLSEHGLRCCIGFVAAQCGYHDDVLLDTPAAHATKTEDGPPTLGDLTRMPAWMSLDNRPDHASEDLMEAYRSNDDVMIDDATREAQLAELFARHGDEIVFEN